MNNLEKINLWENKHQMPLYDENIKNKENEFCGTITPYLVEEEENDVKKRGAVLICPGGGYSFVAEKEGETIASWLNFFGVNAFVLNYRVAPYNFPAPLIDAKQAIRYLRNNASKFNIDPEKIAILGCSAGGHLAGLTLEYFDKFEQYSQGDLANISAKPNLGILCYPVVSFSSEFSHNDTVNNILSEKTQQNLDTLSLEKNVRPDMSKTFVWHTAMDNVVDVRNSLSLANALKEKNVPFHLHIFQNGLHGLALAENIEGTKEWTHLLKVLLKDEEYVEKQSYRFL